MNAPHFAPMLFNQIVCTKIWHQHKDLPVSPPCLILVIWSIIAYLPRSTAGTLISFNHPSMSIPFTSVFLLHYCYITFESIFTIYFIISASNLNLPSFIQSHIFGLVTNWPWCKYTRFACHLSIWSWWLLVSRINSIRPFTSPFFDPCFCRSYVWYTQQSRHRMLISSVILAPLFVYSLHVVIRPSSLVCLWLLQIYNIIAALDLRGDSRKPWWDECLLWLFPHRTPRFLCEEHRWGWWKTFTLSQSHPEPGRKFHLFWGNRMRFCKLRVPGLDPPIGARFY